MQVQMLSINDSHYQPVAESSSIEERMLRAEEIAIRAVNEIGGCMTELEKVRLVRKVRSILLHAV